MRYLVLKVTKQQVIQRLSSDLPLSVIMEGNWRITPKKVRDVTRAIAVYSGTIVDEFAVAETRTVHANAGDKLSFDLTSVKDSDLRGRQINYPTSNPASVVTDQKLLKILKEEGINA